MEVVFNNFQRQFKIATTHPLDLIPSKTQNPEIVQPLTVLQNVNRSDIIVVQVNVLNLHVQLHPRQQLHLGYPIVGHVQNRRVWRQVARQSVKLLPRTIDRHHRLKGLPAVAQPQVRNAAGAVANLLVASTVLAQDSFVLHGRHHRPTGVLPVFANQQGFVRVKAAAFLQQPDHVVGAVPGITCGLAKWAKGRIFGDYLELSCKYI